MLKINGECLTVDSFDELRFLKGPENEPLSRDLKWDALQKRILQMFIEFDLINSIPERVSHVKLLRNSA